MANVAVAGTTWSFTTPADTAPLPSGWADSDIGAVGAAGSAAWSGGTFQVVGAGADVWGTADAFHYAYQSLNGDGQIIARVATIQNVNAWTKAGVMIRSSLAANAQFAFMIVSAGKGTALQYRTATGGAAASITGTPAGALTWVKLVRSGNTITASQSVNGSSWTTVGSVSIAMGATVNIGLAVSSHVNSTPATATFDSVSR
jgi:hypothetical protein